MPLEYDPSKRRFLINAGKLAAGLVAAYATGGVFPACSHEKPQSRDSFKIGNTAFDFKGEWPYPERESMYAFYKKAYPLMKDVAGGEPQSMDGKNVTVLLLKEGSLLESNGVTAYTRKITDDGAIMLTGLPGEGSELADLIKTQELFHVFTPQLWDLPDVFRKGLAQYATMAVGRKMKRDYDKEMKRYKGIERFRLGGFHTYKFSTRADWRNTMDLYDIRLMLSGESWDAVHSKDGAFLTKLLDSARNRGGIVPDPFSLSEELFTGDMEEFRERYPILRIPPQQAQYVTVIPSGRVNVDGKDVNIVAVITFATGATEQPLPNVPLRLTLTKDGKSTSNSWKTGPNGSNMLAVDHNITPPYVLEIEAPFDTEKIEFGPSTYRS